jgi:hypothetical protein
MADTMVDQVIARLVPLFRTAVADLTPPMDPSAVYDGPPTEGTPPEYICVGWTSENVPDVQGTTEGQGNDATSESFDVRCELSAITGDNDIAVVQARVNAIRSAIRDEIRDDRTLGGLLASGSYVAVEGSFSWVRDMTPNGPAVTHVLTVHGHIGWLA